MTSMDTVMGVKKLAQSSESSVWLDSNIPGNSTNATVVMLGVRLQN